MSQLDLAYAEDDGENEPMFVDTEEECQLALDLVEWWSHSLMQDGASPEVVEQRGQDLHRALIQMGGEIHSYGRLYNRLQVSALVLDVCARSAISSSVYSEEDDEGPEALADWTADQWSMVREQLILLKSLLLRRDANVLVLPYGQEEQKLPPRNDNIDQDVGALDIFSGEEYKTVLTLLQVHEAVARFKGALQRLVKDSHRRQNKASPKSHSVLLKKLEIIVDEYEGSLSKLLSSPSSAAAASSSGGEEKSSPEEKSDDKDDAGNNKLQTALTSFLLPDLYRSHSDSVNSLPKRLLQDLTKVMTAQSDREQDEPECSYRSLQAKMQSLLKRWCDQVLTKPTLVRLGYGTKEMYDDDVEKCSVSSWGATQQSSDERDHMDMEPISLQQSQSQSPPERPVPATGTKAPGSETHVVTFDIDGEPEPLLTQAPSTPDEDKKPAAVPSPAPDDDEEPLLTQAPPTPDEDKKPAAVPTPAPDEEEEDTGAELQTQPPVPVEEPESPALVPTEKKPEEEAQPTEAAAAAQNGTTTASHATVSPSSVRKGRSSLPDSSGPPARQRRSARSTDAAAFFDDGDDENITDPQSQRTPPMQGSKKRRSQKNGVSRKRNTVADLWPSSSDDEEKAPPRRHSWTAKRVAPRPKRPRLSSPGGKKVKRRPFTQEEKKAIIAGVKRYGKGSWKEIREGANGALQTRTPVNIKDCYRTMVKRGEVPE